MRGSVDYQLPRTVREARRLEIQSELLREGTERLLAALPLRAGMTAVRRRRALDRGALSQARHRQSHRHKLPHLIEQATGGAPDGTQVTGVIRTIAELAEFLPLLLDMVRDKLREHGVASDDELDRLAAALATAGEQPSTYCYRPMLVGAWRVKAA